MLFERRKRAVSNPAFNQGARVNTNAQTAAVSAFLNSQASNASLSAAAAAAAMSSRPTTPTSVADVQTKRTMRRTNSNSSMGSSVTGSARGPPGAQLERRGSSGSMTERTFRDPSPNRGSARPSSDDAPPVPVIPKNITPTPAMPHRRAASVETPVLPRIASPTPNLVSGRGSSLDPMRGKPAARRTGPRNSSLASVQELTGIERPSSRGSVNFSYPTGARDTSPYGQRRLTSPTPQSANQRTLSQQQKQNLVYDPNTRSFRPEVELLFYEQSIRDAAERSVKKKKRVAVQGSTGTHLADGTVGGRIKGTAVHTSEPPSEALRKTEAVASVPTPPTDGPPPRRKKKPVSTSKINHQDDSHTASASDYESDTSEKPARVNARGVMPLSKKPSIVREEREREEAEDDTSRNLQREAALNKLESGTAEARPISPVPLPPSGGPRGHGRGTSPVFVPNIEEKYHTRSISQPAPTFNAPSKGTSVTDSSTSESKAEGSGSTKVNRVQSVSPIRTAHFLTAPESLAVRHQPPVRSISPRKSALKHSPSSRGSSPNGDMTRGSTIIQGPSAGELSDASTAMSDERITVKKKSVRVSFDDESNVVLGKAETPAVSDTQGKRGWFGSIGRGKKKDSILMDDEDDEVMKPRPALPSFGSVREKKVRDNGERPLVHPGEPSEPSYAALSPPFTTTIGESIESKTGQSSDHAVGAVIAQDHTARNEAMIQSPQEPLPPEVTSVEGSGYVSDDASSINDIEPDPPTKHSDNTKMSPQEGHVESQSSTLGSPIVHEEPVNPVSKTNGNGAIPALAFTKASPTLEEMEQSSNWPNMPGVFPDAPGSSVESSQISIVEHHPTEPTPASLGITEPEPVVYSKGSPVVGDIAAENVHRRPSDIEEELEESDNSSIYSDAAEDLSDMQGDGFMSLDAVVESPIVPKIPGLAITTPPDSPTVKAHKEKAFLKSTLLNEPTEPKPDESWDKTQRYWKGLTTERKNEMERAARDEVDEDSFDEEVKLAPKPKKQQNIPMESQPKITRVNKTPPNSRLDRTYQISPGAKAGPDGHAPTMRSSMRAAPPITDDSIHMRSSMRAAPPTTDDTAHMRKSMRSNGSIKTSLRGSSESTTLPVQPKGSLQKKYRPIPTPQPEIKPSPVEVKKHVRSMSGGIESRIVADKAATKPTPILQRKGSADSDSSFKRVRPSTEGYSMKRSMRGPQQRQTPIRPSSPEVPASTIRSSRFSLRSLSPTGFNNRETPPRAFGQTMRTQNAPTLRTFAPDTTQSSRNFLGFGRSKPSPKAKAAPTRASRFADSSDEEDARPSYSSRFIDSSDEEDEPIPRPLGAARPSALRSTPARANAVDGDSSDTPDSDDEKPSKPAQSSTAVEAVALTATGNQANVGKALASGSLRRSGSGRDFIGATTTTSITAGPAARPEQKRRSSFMSILRRKKPDPASKVRKSDIESAARRDTPLERSRADREAVKRQDSNFSTASGSMSPKLQKRNAPQRTGTNENWPLTSPHPIINEDDVDEEKRPKSAGAAHAIDVNGNGSPAKGKPELGTRRVTATGLAAVDLSIVTPPKKKKKFGRLRRAFRLDD